MSVVEEIPLSNLEVYNILKINIQSPIVKDFFDYLKNNQINPLYPLDELRELKKTNELNANIVTLATVSNSNCIDILDEHDKATLRNHFNISNN